MYSKILPPLVFFLVPFIPVSFNVNAVELAPNPNTGSIVINTTGYESHGEPFENFGSITIQSGGELTNFLEFTGLDLSSFTIDFGGRLINDSVEGVFVVDDVSSLHNNGVIDNNGRMKNSWSFRNALTGVLNNNVGAAFTNTRGMDNPGTVNNAGDFVNSVDTFSGDGASWQSAGTWNNLTGSTFTNYGVSNNFGILNNSGQFVNRVFGGGGITQGKVNNYDTVNNLAGGVMDNEYRWFNRSGSVINNSGTFNNTLVGLGLSNESGSTINNETGGTFNNNDSLINAGAINNAGTFNINAVVSGTGTYTQTGGATVVNSSLSASNIDIQGGTVTGAGTITGPVTIGAAASIGPGNSPGTLIIIGDIGLLGTLDIEVGGTAAGAFDVLDVTGTANLSGDLNVSLWGGYNPFAGDSFDILTADTIFGEFNPFSLAALDTGLRWDIAYILDDFGTDTVRLSVVTAVPVPPAVWLFGSGLIGFFRIARRNKAA